VRHTSSSSVGWSAAYVVHVAAAERACRGLGMRIGATKLRLQWCWLELVKELNRLPLHPHPACLQHTAAHVRLLRTRYSSIAWHSRARFPTRSPTPAPRLGVRFERGERRHTKTRAHIALPAATCRHKAHPSARPLSCCDVYGARCDPSYGAGASVTCSTGEVRGTRRRRWER
jgi:hypothetical protein